MPSTKRLFDETDVQRTPKKRRTLTPPTTPRTPIRTHPMHTRFLTLTTTRAAVLSTPELLTLILSHLPATTLLHSARLVSSTWHQLITTTSPTLRAATYLSSPQLRGTGKKEWYVFDQLTSHLGLFRSGDEIALQSQLGYLAAKQWAERQLSSRPTEINALILRRTEQGGMLRPLAERAMVCEGLSLLSPFEAGLSKDKAEGWIGLLKTDGVWSRMLVSQPPVRVVEAWVHYDVVPKKGTTSMALRSGLSSAPERKVWDFTRSGRGAGRERKPTGKMHIHVERRDGQGVTVGDVMGEIVNKARVLQGKDDAEVEVRSGSGKWGSIVWLLGAVFVSEGEREGMEGRRIGGVGG
ncbi:unnamed protein product [Zymoseptoria tritici ST99CH_1E4]|uniref:F-box domain-containing protein n=1 Tax=Zymoseptoria tritici ST99CH_1E4 TaxID=1276532 RepID=A0A2H1FY31_ZYMTR|nr:unnamed protein product [Zymoseptoria tritici ST99CH_1E4]